MVSNVAVLLAAYNGEKWIEQQITTILNQQGVDLHLYISLDLSADSTLNIINELSQQYPQITVLPYGQRFGSAAPNFYHLLLNVPIENYDYIALSDQDDIWLEDKLKRAINVLEAEKAFGYSSNVFAFWSNGKKKLIKKAYPQYKYDYLFEAPGPGCTFVIKKELATDIKYFFGCKRDILIELGYHDWLIYAFARSREYKWVIDNCALIEYRQHNNNQLGVNNGLKAFISRTRKALEGEVIEQVVKTICFLNIENEEFIKKWYKSNKIEYLKLAYFSKELRRKGKDRILFFCFCIISFLKEIHKK
ncbi:glycosyl transferase [Spirochaetia bacterium]|nr:glycosyl transferase [Spirochaetia bacterium]